MSGDTQMHAGGNVHTDAVCAPVPSVTSHRLPCPCSSPDDRSSLCHSNADSGPWSVMVILALCLVRVCVYACVYSLMYVDILMCVSACVCVHPCVLFFLFRESPVFHLSSQKAPEIRRCAAAVAERRSQSTVGVRRSSAAAAEATGRGQRR